MRIVKEAEERKMKFWMWLSGYLEQKASITPVQMIF